jgi:uncharacterized protein (TIGR00725 family)
MEPDAGRPLGGELRSRPIIGVMGAGRCDPPTYAAARELGRGLARTGYVLLCGGGSGVMEAAARGAHEAGGLTIGILPGQSAADSPPNAYIDLPIFTGLSYARNVINVLSSRVVVAVSGGSGTLSEIALALKYEKPVVLLGSWRFEIEGFEPPESLYRASDVGAALAHIARICPPRQP